MHGMHGSNVAQAGVWTALQQQVKKVEEVEDQVKEVRSKEGEICEVEKTWNCVTPKSFLSPKVATKYISST